jgi:hypothetical protein
MKVLACCEGENDCFDRSEVDDDDGVNLASKHCPWQSHLQSEARFTMADLVLVAC